MLVTLSSINFFCDHAIPFFDSVNGDRMRRTFDDDLDGSIRKDEPLLRTMQIWYDHIMLGPLYKLLRFKKIYSGSNRSMMVEMKHDRLTQELSE